MSDENNKDHNDYDSFNNENPNFDNDVLNNGSGQDDDIEHDEDPMMDEENPDIADRRGRNRRSDERTVTEGNQKKGLISRMFGVFGGSKKSDSGTARDLDDDSSQAKKTNRIIIIMFIIFLFLGIAALGYQLLVGYNSNMEMDASAAVKAPEVTGDKLIAGQRVSQEYADKVAEAEKERLRNTGGKGSFVEQKVDVLGKEEGCPGCLERIKALEQTALTTNESIEKLLVASRTLGQNQQALNEEMKQLRTQLANVRTAAPPPQQQADPNAPPIPVQNYYKDYRGREFMSTGALTDEYTVVSGMINRFVEQDAGRDIQYYATYQPPVNRVDAERGDNAQGGGLQGGNFSDLVNAPDSLPVGYYDGQLEIGVNTDKGNSPLVATITTGPYRGTQLFANGYSPNKEGVQIQFTAFSKPNGSFGRTSAFAIDPTHREPGVASDINNHYLSRILGAAITRGIQGWGDAYRNQGTTVNNSVGGVTTSKMTDGKSAIYQGIGDAAGATADILSDMTNRPPTIKVDAQTFQIGIYVVSGGVINSGFVR